MTATYETATHKGSGSATFIIEPMPLPASAYDTSGLTVEKVYDGSDTAEISGTLTITGSYPNVTADLGSATAAFASADAGSREVTISGILLTGDNAWMYIPTDCVLTGTITPKPVTVTVDQGSEAEYGSEPESFTGSYTDIDSVQQTGEIGRAHV